MNYYQQLRDRRMSNKPMHFGGNDTGKQERIWPLAKRHNKKSFELYGAVTSRRIVTGRKYEPVLLI